MLDEESPRPVRHVLLDSQPPRGGAGADGDGDGATAGRRGSRRADERRSYDDIVQEALRPIPRGKHRAGTVAREQRRRRQESTRDGSQTPELPRRRLPGRPKTVAVLGTAACLAVAAAVAIPALDTQTYAAGDRSRATTASRPDRVTPPRQSDAPSPAPPRPPAASRRAAPGHTTAPKRTTQPERTKKATPGTQPRSSRVDAVVWEAGVYYRTGTVVTYDGITFRCREGHTTQAGWDPPIVPALWEYVSGQ